MMTNDFYRLCKQPARLSYVNRVTAREVNRALLANSRLNITVVAIIKDIIITRGAEDNLVQGRLQARPPSDVGFPC
jgi:hypothetical protein